LLGFDSVPGGKKDGSGLVCSLHSENMTASYGIEEGKPNSSPLAELAGLLLEPMMKLFLFLLFNLMFAKRILVTRPIKVDDVA